MVCGILADQGSSLCPLHRQADSYPLSPTGPPGKSRDKASTLSTKSYQYRTGYLRLASSLSLFEDEQDRVGSSLTFAGTGP